MDSKKAFITGAGGFIGTNLIKYLISKDYHVTAMGSGKIEPDELKPMGAGTWIDGPVTLHNLKQLSLQPDYIFHCAGSGSVGYSIENPYADFQSNASSLVELLEYVRIHSPGSKVVYLSSGAVYGGNSKIPMSENDIPMPVSPYGHHKLIGERICKSYSQQFQIKTISVRLFSIYGEGLKKQLLWDACRKISSGNYEFYGTGKEIRDWLHVDDAVRLLELAVKNADINSPVVNAGTGFKITIREILEEIFEYLNKTGQPEFLQKSRAGDPAQFLADVTTANRLGWSPEIDVSEGLKRYVSWFSREELNQK